MTPLKGMSLCIYPVYWLLAKLTFSEADTSTQHTPPPMYYVCKHVACVQHSPTPNMCTHTRALLTRSGSPHNVLHSTSRTYHSTFLISIIVGFPLSQPHSTEAFRTSFKHNLFIRPKQYPKFYKCSSTLPSEIGWCASQHGGVAAAWWS